MDLRGSPLNRLVVIAPEFDWQAEGQRLGETLDALHCLVVLGDVPDETAAAALGIARAQARRRRVTLVDLLGESAPLEHLVPDHDAHGIVDCFTYGLSLRRVSVPVGEDGRLFVVPTGSEPPQYEQILAHRRWDRFAATHRGADELLLVALPASARALEQIVAVSDGAVVVGDVVPPRVPSSRIVAQLRRPQPAKTHLRPLDEIGVGARFNPRRVAAWAGAGGLTLALAIMALWLAARPLADGDRGPASRADTTAAAADALRRSIDSSAREESRAGTVATAAPIPANPQDSVEAAGFVVVLESNSTRAGAQLRLQRHAQWLPAATYVPILVQDAEWYQSRVGAFATAAEADSLLEAARKAGIVDANTGRVIRAPFAFLLDSATATAAPAVLVQYAERELPAYALRQRDGTIRIYVGAFETPDESIPLAEALRASGAPVPPLVYRTGRVF